MWTVVCDKILTGDNLRGRWMDFVDWCIMCCCNGETVDHLLLHCDKAYQLWSLDHLGLHGSCQNQLQILSLVGGIFWESIHLDFGI